VRVRVQLDVFGVSLKTLDVRQNVRRKLRPGQRRTDVTSVMSVEHHGVLEAAPPRSCAQIAGRRPERSGHAPRKSVALQGSDNVLPLSRLAVRACVVVFAQRL
jgi:hypothetical protein